MKPLFIMLSLLVVSVVLFYRPVVQATPHPCQYSHSNDLLLLEDARNVLGEYLHNAGFSVQIDLREEGSFMLGAYPRSDVLWSLRILEPSIMTDEIVLEQIALAAFCLRQGWVWLSIGTRSGERELLSYSQETLENLR